MTRLAIYGAGGLGREVRGMLDFNLQGRLFAGFLDDYKVLGKNEKALHYDDVVVAIADPGKRQVLVDALRHKKFDFKPLLSRDVKVHKSVNIGQGSIICSGVKMTVDIKIGNFVIINLNATIGHDVIVGNFSSIMPSVNISGGVSIGQKTFVGSGATVLQGVKIGDNVVVGAGSLVNKDVPGNCVVMGIPARITRMI